jgi:glycosyltransferase involved in cell wall biosynthesis
LSAHGRLRVCLHVPVPDGPGSGGRAAIVALAQAFSKLEDGEEEYLFHALRDSHNWLTPHLGGACKLLLDKPASRPWYVRAAKRLPVPRRLLEGIGGSINIKSVLGPRTPAAIEAASVDVVHFPLPCGFFTDIPSIYKVHDLQHRHLKEFFSPYEIERRDYLNRSLCNQASVVTVMSTWGREGAVDAYGIAREKVHIVPEATTLSEGREPTSAQLSAVRERLHLPEAFAFYPARTFRHKNHLMLLEALALLRDKEDLSISLVCSGIQDDFYSTIQRRVQDLGLGSQVHFVGYVSLIELKCLYRLCRCLIFPSFYEGWGLPLSEAAAEGVPIACSDISPLREHVGQAAITFDPRRADLAAEALKSLFQDESRRAELIQLGRQRASHFSWDLTVRLLRAHYRRAGGRGLTEEDEQLLRTAPLV